jgi:O-antigen/teichoic acid export membrane protein
LIGRRSVVILAAGLISDLLAFVGLFAITHSLGSDGYGQIAFAQALVATFASVADLGFTSAHIKRISEGKDLDDCVSTFVAVKLTLIAAFIALTLISMFVWTDIAGGSISGTTLSLTMLFLLYYVLYNISSIATATYNGTMEQAKANLVILADPLIRVPLILLFVFGSLGVITMAYAYVLGAIGVTLVGLFFVRRDHFRWRKPRLLRSYFAFARPIVIVTIISAISAQLLIVIIGLAGASGQTGFGSVGLYSGCVAVLSVLALFGTAVSTMTYPSFSKMHTDGELHKIRDLTLQAERYISMIGLPIIAVIVLFPSQTAHALLGFSGAGTDMLLLSIATFLGMLNCAHGSQLYAVNRPDIGAKVTLLAFVVSLSFSVLLVPQGLFGLPLAGLGDEGAAITNLVTAAISFVVVRWIVHDLTSTEPNPRLGIHLLAGIVTAIVVYFISFAMPITGFITLVVMGLAAYAVFFLVLHFTGEFSKDDLSYFLDLLNVRKMGAYVREELKQDRETGGED